MTVWSGIVPVFSKKMGMVAEEGPGVTRRVGVGEQLAHAFDKTIPVGIIPEDQPSLDAADDDMVEDTGGVETGMAGHGPS